MLIQNIDRNDFCFTVGKSSTAMQTEEGPATELSLRTLVELKQGK